MNDVGSTIRAALLAREPRDKVMLTRQVARDWRLGRLTFAFDATMPEVPGRPDRPELLPPGRMPKRGKAQSERGRIALFHANTSSWGGSVVAIGKPGAGRRYYMYALEIYVFAM